MSESKLGKILYILFFLSGFSALIYEITWVRKLSLMFGTDTYAVATIIAVFFTGLALGSFLFGKIVDRAPRIKNSLYLYGLLELGIGVYAVGTPWIIKGIEAVQVAFWKGFEPSFGGFSLFTFLLSVVGLIVPTVLMGGTLPVVVKALARIQANDKRINSNERIGGEAGGLYAVNTAGAVLGVLAAGFWLIASVGVNQTIWLAALVSVLVGVVALKISRMYANDKRMHANERILRPTQDRIGTLAPISSKFVSISVLAGFGLAGFAAIALEVLWTRVLVTVIGGSVYAFSIVLVAFLLGIALGSSAGAWLIKRWESRMQTNGRRMDANPTSPRLRGASERMLLWFALIELALGASVILFIPAFGNLPFWFLSVYQLFGKSFVGLQVGLWLMSAGVMMVPTLLMGVAFPVVVQTFRAGGLGDRVGRVYAVNTVGGVFGALVAGFVLIPTVGVQIGILISSVLYLLIGLGLALVTKDRRFKVTALVVILVLVFWVVRQKPWDPYIFSAGFYVDPSAYSGQAPSDILKKLTKDEILYEAEGISAHVAVRKERDGNINLRINGKADASTGADMENQLILGHLPLLLHPSADGPKDVLVVGMGSGITLGSVLSHPVEHVDAIEIEEKVIEGAEFFNEYSNNALSDQRTKIIVADGRNFLLASNRKYDVISSEPSNPWLTGSSKLFTKEYFELLRGGVRQDGVVLHWINLYSLDINGLKSALAAFREVFPHMLVFGMPASNDLAMIGSQEKILFEFESLEKALQYPKVSKDLAKVGIGEPFEILAYFVLDEEAVDKIAGSARPNTDNNPIVEFSAPKALYSPVRVNPWRLILDNLTNTSEVLEDSTSEVTRLADEFRRSRILTHINLIERNIGEGIKEGEKALTIDNKNPYLAETLARLYFEEGSSFLNQGEYASAIESFERSLELKKTPEAYINLALAYEGFGELSKAKGALDSSIEQDPEFAIAYFELGRVNQELGDLNASIEAFTKVLELDTENIQVMVYLGNLYILRKDFGRAEEYLNRVLKFDPQNGEARELLESIP